MNNAEHEPLITKVEPMAIPLQRPNKDAELISYRKPEQLEESPIEFSAWEQLTLKLDATIEATKFIGVMTPHFISIIWSYLMGNKAKLATAIAGLIVAVLTYFNIVIPESLLPYIASGVALLIGWLIPSPAGKPTEEQK